MATFTDRQTKKYLTTFVLTAVVTVVIYGMRYTGLSGLSLALMVFINPLAKLVCMPMQKLGIPHAAVLSSLLTSFAFWFVVILALRHRFKRARYDDYHRDEEDGDETD